MTTGKEIDLSPDRVWTSTGDMLLLQLINERFRLADICAMLNRSEESVKRRVSYLRRHQSVVASLTARTLPAINTAWSNYHGVRSGRVRFR